MKLVIFGLSVSSSWGNGHATLWRGILRALAQQGHRVAFFERDVPYYAAHRDLHTLPPGSDLVLYRSWQDVLPSARCHLDDADAALVTSYCPDGAAASELCLDSRVPIRAFYDLDTPVTLERLRAGEDIPYLPRGGLADFDLVLSFTGGPALHELTTLLGARLVAPLYGSADPSLHRPVPSRDAYAADLSYLGTYAADRQPALDELLLKPARALPLRRFLLGGSLYPKDFPWTPNLWYLAHVPPPDHPAFYSSSRLTLNVTRAPMATMGYCPSGRLFEAAACGVPLITDDWPGLEDFFRPGHEIVIARSASDVLAAIGASREDLGAIARAARERTLDEHTAERRAQQLINLLESARSPRRPRQTSPQDASKILTSSPREGGAITAHPPTVRS